MATFFGARLNAPFLNKFLCKNPYANEAAITSRGNQIRMKEGHSRTSPPTCQDLVCFFPRCCAELLTLFLANTMSEMESSKGVAPHPAESGMTIQLHRCLRVIDHAARIFLIEYSRTDGLFDGSRLRVTCQSRWKLQCGRL
jgi:hypothetical protein